MNNSRYDISHKFLELNNICVCSKEFKKQFIHFCRIETISF